MVSRPIDVLCEEERLRRLSERMAFDDGDGAEPARQRRARILVEEMTTMGPRLRSPSSEKRRSKAVKALEAGLQARWKAVVHEMAETPKRASEAEKSHGSQTTRSRTEGVVLQDLCECKPG
ncbi:unnamed protein product, partial [Effrenium voratum]